MDECLGRRPRYFTLRDLELQIGFGDARHGGPDGEARVRIELDVGGEVAYTSARGDGPVHALDVGLRGLVDKFYPTLTSVRLVDYKVRVISTGEGTGSVVRVLIQSSDGDEVWGTVGVSPNIIRASWNAMLDALDYKLVKEGVAPYVSRQGEATRAALGRNSPPP